jgi:hypothetical protein
MPLPVASCADEVPTQTCCTTLYDVAARLCYVTTSAVCECFDPSCADRDFRSFVSVGPQIEDPIGDSLIVHMPRIGSSPASSNSIGALLPAAVHIADFEIRLLEFGWPTIEMDDMEQTISIPDAAYVNAISRHVYGHGERMYRALVDGIQHNTLVTLPAGFTGKLHLGDLVPQTSGQLVGWNITVRLQITFPPYVRGS